jgi:hypothetical protein
VPPLTTKRLCPRSSFFRLWTGFFAPMGGPGFPPQGPGSCDDRVDAPSGSRTLRAGCAGCLRQSLSQPSHPRCLSAWPGRGNGHSDRTRKHLMGASFPSGSRAMIARPVRGSSTTCDVSPHICPSHWRDKLVRPRSNRCGVHRSAGPWLARFYHRVGDDHQLAHDRDQSELFGFPRLYQTIVKRT